MFKGLTAAAFYYLYESNYELMQNLNDEQQFLSG